MPDPNTEHGLRVQLATALRERDLAVRVADGKSAELMEALADATTLRADVKRLREALEKIRGWSVPGSIAENTATAALCTGGRDGNV